MCSPENSGICRAWAGRMLSREALTLPEVPSWSSSAWDHQSQPFWYQGPVWWEVIFPWMWRCGRRLMVLGWRKCVTFIVHFISILITLWYIMSSGNNVSDEEQLEIQVTLLSLTSCCADGYQSVAWDLGTPALDSHLMLAIKIQLKIFYTILHYIASFALYEGYLSDLKSRKAFPFLRN